MNQPFRPPTTEDLRRALREHCLNQARNLHECLGEAVECLGDANHLGALGALSGVDEELRQLTTVLELVPRIECRNQA